MGMAPFSCLHKLSYRLLCTAFRQKIPRRHSSKSISQRLRVVH